MVYIGMDPLLITLTGDGRELYGRRRRRRRFVPSSRVPISTTVIRENPPEKNDLVTTADTSTLPESPEESVSVESALPEEMEGEKMLPLILVAAGFTVLFLMSKKKRRYV